MKIAILRESPCRNGSSSLLADNYSNFENKCVVPGSGCDTVEKTREAP